MIQEESSNSKNRVNLEIKSGVWELRLITAKPSLRGGVYKWTESNIEPCVNHYLQDVQIQKYSAHAA